MITGLLDFGEALLYAPFKPFSSEENLYSPCLSLAKGTDSTPNRKVFFLVFIFTFLKTKKIHIFSHFSKQKIHIYALPKQSWYWGPFNRWMDKKPIITPYDGIIIQWLKEMRFQAIKRQWKRFKCTLLGKRSQPLKSYILYGSKDMIFWKKQNQINCKNKIFFN